jgi:hypothetical protein
MSDESQGRLPWDPTPAEIARRCAEIRQGWPHGEAATRKGGGLVPRTREKRKARQRRRFS